MPLVLPAEFLGLMVELPEAKVMGWLLPAAGLVIRLFAIRCPECGRIWAVFPANTANTAETDWTGTSRPGSDFRFWRMLWAFLTN